MGDILQRHVSLEIKLQGDQRGFVGSVHISLTFEDYFDFFFKFNFDYFGNVCKDLKDVSDIPLFPEDVMAISTMNLRLLRCVRSIDCQ